MQINIIDKMIIKLTLRWLLGTSGQAATSWPSHLHSKQKSYFFTSIKSRNPIIFTRIENKNPVIFTKFRNPLHHKFCWNLPLIKLSFLNEFTTEMKDQLLLHCDTIIDWWWALELTIKINNKYFLFSWTVSSELAWTLLPKVFFHRFVAWNVILQKLYQNIVAWFWFSFWIN